MAWSELVNTSVAELRSKEAALPEENPTVGSTVIKTPVGVPCTEQEALELFAVSIHVMAAPAWYRFQLASTSVAFVGLYDLKTPPAR